MTYQSEFYEKKNILLSNAPRYELLCGVTKEEPQELFISVVRPAVRSSELVHSRVHLSFNLNNGYLIEIGFREAFSQRLPKLDVKATARALSVRIKEAGA